MKFILMVTWLMLGQPSSSYSVEFENMAACEIAGGRILAEVNIARQLNPVFFRDGPFLSAVCSPASGEGRQQLGR